MNTYSKKIDYRKIYRDKYGSIPMDENGRSFEIHHIDGNRSNNHPDNLKAVSIQEHYNIHYEQGDYGACFLIAGKMSIKPDTISEISRRVALERVEKGTHNLIGDSNPSHRRIKEGTHHFLNPDFQRNVALSRVKNGTHNLLSGNIQRDTNQKRLSEGTHHSQVKHTCPHCGYTGNGAGMFRWHFERCKSR